MIRHVACLALVLLAGIPLRAGELDTEFGGKIPPAPAVAPAATLLTASRDVKTGDVKASELDEEMPSQACAGASAMVTAASAGASAMAASAGAMAMVTAASAGAMAMAASAGASV